MSITVKNIIPAKQAEVSQTTQYTATNCKTIIDDFTATNTTAGNITISINIVEDGESTGNSNLIIKAKSIAPSQTYGFPQLIGTVLEAGSYISTIASAGASLTIAASGREIV